MFFDSLLTTKKKSQPNGNISFQNSTLATVVQFPLGLRRSKFRKSLKSLGEGKINKLFGDLREWHRKGFYPYLTEYAMRFQGGNGQQRKCCYLSAVVSKGYTLASGRYSSLYRDEIIHVVLQATFETSVHSLSRDVPVLNFKICRLPFCKVN